MKRLIVWGLVVPSLLCMLTTSLEAEQARLRPPTAAQRADFLTAIEGPWEGQARVTPVGPRPYDMTFARTAPGRLEGQAHPGVSIHYWTFYEQEETLRLRFLSTFAGNRRPLFLTATSEHNGALVFHTSQPRFLEVHVRPRADSLTMKIFLRGAPHVEIDLRRLP